MRNPVLKTQSPSPRRFRVRPDATLSIITSAQGLVHCSSNKWPTYADVRGIYAELSGRRGAIASPSHAFDLVYKRFAVGAFDIAHTRSLDKRYQRRASERNRVPAACVAVGVGPGEELQRFRGGGGIRAAVFGIRMKVEAEIGQDFGAGLIGDDQIEAGACAQSAFAAAAWTAATVGFTVLPSLFTILVVVSLFCLA